MKRSTATTSRTELPDAIGPNPFLTLEEASRVARTPVASLRHWIRTGKLRAIKPGRRVLVRRAELMRVLEGAGL